MFNLQPYNLERFGTTLFRKDTNLMRDYFKCYSTTHPILKFSMTFTSIYETTSSERRWERCISNPYSAESTTTPIFNVSSSFPTMFSILLLRHDFRKMLHIQAIDLRHGEILFVPRSYQLRFATSTRNYFQVRCYKFKPQIFNIWRDSIHITT